MRRVRARVCCVCVCAFGCLLVGVCITRDLLKRDDTSNDMREHAIVENDHAERDNNHQTRSDRNHNFYVSLVGRGLIAGVAETCVWVACEVRILGVCMCTCDLERLCSSDLCNQNKTALCVRVCEGVFVCERTCVYVDSPVYPFAVLHREVFLEPSVLITGVISEPGHAVTHIDTHTTHTRTHTYTLTDTGHTHIHTPSGIEHGVGWVFSFGLQ